MSIRHRLFLTTIGVLLVGCGTLAAVVLWSFERFFVRSVMDDLTARTAAVAESVGDWLERGDIERVALVVRRYGAQESIALRVLGPDGRLLATSQDDARERATRWVDVPGVAGALGGARTHGVSPGVHEEERRVFAAMPIDRGGKRLGAVRMSRSLTRLEAHRRGTVVTVLAAFGVVLALSAALSAWLARGLGRQIQAMRDFAVALGRGQLAQRLPGMRRDELGELAEELNRMAARLAELESERRAFLANASHELRTPVSNVHVTLQALESGAGEDPELRGRFLRTAVDETTRLRRLIQDLLDLGRLEAGVTGLDRVRVSLRAVVERATRAIEGRALEQRVRLEVAAEGDAVVEIDGERIAQALQNLLDNALKMSPPGGTLRVVGRREDGNAAILVADEGPGIDPADLPHVFEQFYTADRSRRRGGTGLGLAIARRIVEAHGGAIHASSTPGQGATFRIVLPLAPAAAPQAMARTA
jgi:signal transduction histidine kinase